MWPACPVHFLNLQDYWKFYFSSSGSVIQVQCIQILLLLTRVASTTTDTATQNAKNSSPTKLINTPSNSICSWLTSVATKLA